MAIQIPNPGTGNGATGDNEFVLWSKVKDNFSDQTNAASKLVGKDASQIALNRDVNEVAFSSAKNAIQNDESITTLAQFPDGGTHRIGSIRYTDIPFRNSNCNIITFSGLSNSKFQIFHGHAENTPDRLYMRSGISPDSWLMIYHDKNTTKEEGTGYLVASSPVLKVQHDIFEKVHQAEQLDIEVKNIKTGVYEITGTTGLREGDGWNLKPPKDVNGNVLCICEASEEDGIITLKTYKKKFDFETVSIVADYEQPSDIPEGATVMLRFNDLSQE